VYLYLKYVVTGKSHASCYIGYSFGFGINFCKIRITPPISSSRSPIQGLFETWSNSKIGFCSPTPPLINEGRTNLLKFVKESFYFPVRPCYDTSMVDENDVVRTQTKGSDTHTIFCEIRDTNLLHFFLNASK
jgi:hypothetical protein